MQGVTVSGVPSGAIRVFNGDGCDPESKWARWVWMKKLGRLK